MWFFFNLDFSLWLEHENTIFRVIAILLVGIVIPFALLSIRFIYIEPSDSSIKQWKINLHSNLSHIVNKKRYVPLSFKNNRLFENFLFPFTFIFFTLICTHINIEFEFALKMYEEYFDGRLVKIWER